VRPGSREQVEGQGHGRTADPRARCVVSSVRPRGAAWQALKNLWSRSPPPCFHARWTTWRTHLEGCDAPTSVHAEAFLGVRGVPSLAAWRALLPPERTGPRLESVAPPQKGSGDREPSRGWRRWQRCCREQHDGCSADGLSRGVAANEGHSGRSEW